MSCQESQKDFVWRRVRKYADHPLERIEKGVTLRDIEP